MKLVIINQTPLVYGGHPTTALVESFVNARLGSYGQAIDRIWISMLYTAGSRLSNPTGADFQRLVAQSPRATFYRAKRQIKIRCLCRDVPCQRILDDGHLTRDELVPLLAAVAAALDLVGPRLRCSDDFDLPAFLHDAREALAQCPAALRHQLAQ